jgi:hypothetical protein
MAAYEGDDLEDDDAFFSFLQKSKKQISKAMMDYKAALLGTNHGKPAAAKHHRSAQAKVSYDHVLGQTHGKNVPPTWILLDNQSTVDVVYEKSLLSSICQSKGHMDIHCNAGVMTTNHSVVPSRQNCKHVFTCKGKGQVLRDV